MAAMVNRVDDEQSILNKLQRQMKEQTTRYQELEEELQAERQARLKVRIVSPQ